MRRRQFSMAEKGCSGTVMWISHVLGSGFILGRNKTFWHSLLGLYRPHFWINVRPRNGSHHSRDDLYGGLEARYIIARGCEGRTASELGSSESGACTGSVRPAVLDPAPKATNGMKQEGGHDTALQKSELQLCWKRNSSREPAG